MDPKNAADAQQGSTEPQGDNGNVDTSAENQQKPEGEQPGNLFDASSENEGEDKSEESVGNIFDEPAEGDEEGEGTDGSEGKEGEGAPEAYETPEMPEGVEWDEEVGGEFSEIAKELGLSQEAHDKLAGLGAKIVAKQQGELMAAWNQQVAEWHKDIKGDAEIGGKKLPETLGGVRSAIEQFAASPEDAQAILNDPVVSNRPAFIKLMNNVRKSMSEGSAIEGTGGDREEAPIYSRLWGNK